jgi:hypothetical protein
MHPGRGRGESVRIEGRMLHLTTRFHWPVGASSRSLQRRMLRKARTPNDSSGGERMGVPGLGGRGRLVRHRGFQGGIPGSGAAGAGSDHALRNSS